jgi:hypothetical protein
MLWFLFLAEDREGLCRAVGFMTIVAHNAPDFRTIADFINLPRSKWRLMLRKESNSMRLLQRYLVWENGGRSRG